MLDNKYIHVNTRTLSDKIYHNDALILTYTIDYPEIISEKYPESAYRLSLHYMSKAMIMKQYCKKFMYAMAVKQYEYSVSMGYEVIPFEFYESFTVTLNLGCILSMYFDKYVFSGGAHGNTIRKSDSWNLLTGSEITMDMLFPNTRLSTELVIKKITAQVKQQMNGSDNYYFENYSENINGSFNKNNFYLTDKGMAVFFQQYDIAPYYVGIPVFILPYSSKGPVLPKCRG